MQVPRLVPQLPILKPEYQNKNKKHPTKILRKLTSIDPWFSNQNKHSIKNYQNTKPKQKRYQEKKHVKYFGSPEQSVNKTEG